MKTIMTLAAVSVCPVSGASDPALAGGNGGAIAAGVVGGLAVGAIVGSQANRNYYNGPAYVDQPVIRQRAAILPRLPYRTSGSGPTLTATIAIRRVRVCD